MSRARGGLYFWRQPDGTGEFGFLAVPQACNAGIERPHAFRERAVMSVLHMPLLPRLPKVPPLGQEPVSLLGDLRGFLPLLFIRVPRRRDLKNGLGRFVAL